MPIHIPVSEILHSPKREAPCSVNFWDAGSDGSLWFHPSAVINIPPKSPDLNTSTNIQTPEGGIPDHCVPIRLLGWGGLWLIEYSGPSGALCDS